MLRAFTDGLRRVSRAPWVVAGVWLQTLLVALPFAVMLHGMIADHLGGSLAAAEAASGVNYDWWNEFLAQTSGLGTSFVPAIMGFAAVLKNLSAVADAQGMPAAIASAVAAEILLSVFLAGGLLDRLARDRTVGPAGFFAACGVYFWRFLRLGVGAGAVYWALFAWLHPWLFDTVYPALTRELTVERTAFLYRIGLYALFAAPVLALNVVLDYAKVRAVVEDRRSMVGALVSGARFVFRNAGAAFGLYALDALLFLLVAAVYFLTAPGAAAHLPGFAIGQLYIVSRVVVRLQFAASEIALFQRRLAHAGYVARPVPRWPDSPAAAAIGPQ
jgi:hypothetical protein